MFFTVFTGAFFTASSNVSCNGNVCIIFLYHAKCQFLLFLQAVSPFWKFHSAFCLFFCCAEIISNASLQWEFMQSLIVGSHGPPTLSTLGWTQMLDSFVSVSKFVLATLIHIYKKKHSFKSPDIILCQTVSSQWHLNKQMWQSRCVCLQLRCSRSKTETHWGSVWFHQDLIK